MLEVLAGAGALTDLIATGARLVEPDARVCGRDCTRRPRRASRCRPSIREPRAAGREQRWSLRPRRLATRWRRGARRSARLQAPGAGDRPARAAHRRRPGGAQGRAAARPRRLSRRGRRWPASRDGVEGGADARPRRGRFVRASTRARNGAPAMAVVCADPRRSARYRRRGPTSRRRCARFSRPTSRAPSSTLFSAAGIAALGSTRAGSRSSRGRSDRSAGPGPVGRSVHRRPWRSGGRNSRSHGWRSAPSARGPPARWWPSRSPTIRREQRGRARLSPPRARDPASLGRFWHSSARVEG